MTEVTRILSAIEQGDPQAAEQLLPLVYDELRKLAAQKLAQEKPGQTLQATALVHEAYLRLVDAQMGQNWNGRGHFFAAAAEAMRRILIDECPAQEAAEAGRRPPANRAGRRRRSSSPAGRGAARPRRGARPARTRRSAGRQLVKLRFFAGLSIEEAAEVVGVSRSTAYEHWTYARAWLLAGSR